MTEFWEAAFVEKRRMWGNAPTQSALFAADDFARAGIGDVLLPGIGYGRNALPFLERGIRVTGIEISETAIALARSELGLDIVIHHGPVANMPYDDHRYGGVFSHGLVHLLDAPGRADFFRNCHDQLGPDGRMIVTLLSKRAPMYGRGPKLGDDYYEAVPGAPMYFYDADSVARDLGPFGLVTQHDLDEPGPHGGTMPFIVAVCARGGRA